MLMHVPKDQGGTDRQFTCIECLCVDQLKLNDDTFTMVKNLAYLCELCTKLREPARGRA